MALNSVILLASCVMLGAAVPAGRQQIDDERRGRQELFLQPIGYPDNSPSPFFQRLELPVPLPDAQYYNQPQQVSQSNAGEKAKPSEAQSAKLETLNEPDAEIIPGGEQPNPQRPPPPPQGPQVPIFPQIPGLLPGQQVFIVHPQHQIYSQNPVYMVPNGYQPNVPGYRRFYLVQNAPGQNYASQGIPGGYQNLFLVDPNSQRVYAQQPVVQPGYPNYQRLEGPTPTQPEQQGNQIQESAPINSQPQYVGASAQFSPLINGIPQAGLRYINLPRRIELPAEQTGLRREYTLPSTAAVQFANQIDLASQLVPPAEGHLPVDYFEEQTASAENSDEKANIPVEQSGEKKPEGEVESATEDPTSEIEEQAQSKEPEKLEVKEKEATKKKSSSDKA